MTQEIKVKSPSSTELNLTILNLFEISYNGFRILCRETTRCGFITFTQLIGQRSFILLYFSNFSGRRITHSSCHSHCQVPVLKALCMRYRQHLTRTLSISLLLTVFYRLSVVLF